MQKFSWVVDFKRIMWKETSIVNLQRSFVAGIFWGILIACGVGGPHDWYMPFLFPIIFPIAYLIFFLPVGLLCGFICKFDFPLLWILGFITILFSFILLPADPVLFFVQKFKPKFIPIEKYGFINFALIIFALRPTEQKNVDSD